MKQACSSFVVVVALIAGSANSLWAQASGHATGPGEFSAPQLRKPPVTGILTLTPSVPQPQTINLDSTIVAPSSTLKPSEIKPNLPLAPAPSLMQATPAAPPPITEPESLTGPWAPMAVTNWPVLDRTASTSILKAQPAPPHGLGIEPAPRPASLNLDMNAPVVVPLAPALKPQRTTWDISTNRLSKLPKYKWK